MSLPSKGTPNDQEGLSPWGGAGRLWRLIRKELSEVLRDRRTIITLVLMPLLLYPLLLIAFQQVAAANLLGQTSTATKGKQNGQPQPIKYRFAVASESQRARLELIFDLAHNFRLFQKFDVERDWDVTVTPDLEGDIRSGKYDLGIRVTNKVPRPGPRGKGRPPIPKPDKPNPGADAPPPTDPFANQEVELEVLSMADSAHSQAALEKVEQFLLWFHQAMVSMRFQVRDPERPLALVHLKVQSFEGESSSILPALVPLILILMTITGAVYPAIDSTAGERERGTLEMLVAAPVPRLGLLFAKYVTVVTVAVLTGVVNLAGMVVTLKFSGLEEAVIPGGLDLIVVLQVAALLLLFALFFSALLLAITSFARSFKEAQAYLIPLMVASLAPGIVGILPGIRLSGLLVVAPLVNIVLLGRDLFQGRVDPGTAALVVGVTLLYAGGAIALAARIFGSESVLYSEQSGWADLFRRPEDSSPAASVSAALWCLALMVPLHFILQGFIHVMGPTVPLMQVAAVIVLSILLFLVLPGVAAWLGRVRPGTGFALRWPGPWHLVAAVLLGLCLWPGVLWVVSLLVDVTRGPAIVAEQVGGLRQLIPFGILLMVIVPAIVEELFFRGFLFSSLERACPGWVTILITALLFGVLHVLQGGPLGTMRFWPSTAMGLILGYARWTSGSVWPGLFLHVLHNASLEIAVQSGTRNLEESWILGSAAALAVGTALLTWGYLRERRAAHLEPQREI